MSEINVTTKTKVLKEALNNIFVSANNQGIASGLGLKYTIEKEDIDEGQLWKVALFVKEPAAPERCLQVLSFLKPNNIDAKSMEYEVIIAVLATMTQNTLMLWNQLGKEINKDPKLQKTIIDNLNN